jgi:hypothetical protein
MVHGAWCMVYGLCCMVHCLWCMVNHKENKKYKFLKHFLAGTFWAALFN